MIINHTVRSPQWCSPLGGGSGLSKTRVTGFKEPESALAEIGKRSTQLAVTRRALMKAAEPMKDEAIQKAPDDSGELKSSIVLATRAGAEAGKAAYARRRRRGGGSGGYAGCPARFQGR